MQVLNRFCAVAKSKSAAVVAIATAAATSAHAELPAAVSTAIAGYQTDATTAIGLIMGAGVVIWGLMRLKSKMGW
jgi:spore coat polysaccharide biosynthesis protein SpsF (cytidylyltransferase family)